MTITILESAVDDLERGKHFYARHGRGVGEYFLDSLLLYAGIHQEAFGYHRLLSKRLPYAVYHLMEDDVAIVEFLDKTGTEQPIYHSGKSRSLCEPHVRVDPPITVSLVYPVESGAEIVD